MVLDIRDIILIVISFFSVIKERRCRIEWLYFVSVCLVSFGIRMCLFVEWLVRLSVIWVSWIFLNFMIEKIFLKKKEKINRCLKYKYFKCFKLFLILIVV